MRVAHLLFALLPAAAAVWAFAPASPASIEPPRVVNTAADAPALTLATLDRDAFRAPLWVAPPAPPPVAAAPPPPPPLKLQLLAVVHEGETFKAMLYDPDSDKILVAAAGETVVGKRVEKVTAAGVHIATGRAADAGAEDRPAGDRWHTMSRVQWPRDKFYWSVLEAPQWKRAGPLPSGLRPMLEDELPVAVNGVHAVCAPIGGGRLLVCAAERDELASLKDDIVGLSPDQLPDFAASDLPPFTLNLLVGELEPVPIRRARMRRHLLAAASVLLSAGLVATGLLRREAQWDSAAVNASQATTALADAIKPGQAPDELVLEVNRLHRLHEAAARIQPSPDAALALGALLRSWPSAVSSKPQALSVSESGATVSVSVEGDATPFLKALKPPAGWSLEEPRVNTAGAVTRLTLQLRPVSGPGGFR